MRNFKPPFLGESWFDWVGTSPGRIDPESGEFVESTAIPEDERQGFFDWIEVTPGRVNPKTGKLVVPSNLPPEQREKFKRAHAERREAGGQAPPERSFSRFSRGGDLPALPAPRGESRKEAPEVFEKMFGPRVNGPKMNGPRVGCGTCSESYMSGAEKDGPGAVLWIFLGTVTVIALEAFGVTHWSQQK